MNKLLLVCCLIYAGSASAWCYFDRADPKSGCNCQTSPAKKIKKSEKDNIQYSIEDEIKDGNGNVISLVLFQEYPPIDSFMVHSPGGLVQTRWFKTRQACERGRKDLMASDRAQEKAEDAETNKRLSPYE